MKTRTRTLDQSFLSALVNLVDTARQHPEKFNGFENHLQLDREIQIMCFLNDHPNVLVKAGRSTL